MKILALMSLDMFRLTLGWALETNGHRVYQMNDISKQSLEEAIRDFQPEIVMDAGWDELHVDQHKVNIMGQLLKKHNIFHVYFAEEDWLHFERWSKRYVASTMPEFVLTRSANCIPYYRGLGIGSEYMDVGCNPYFHRPLPPTLKYACDVSVIVNGQFVWDVFRRKSITDLVAPLFHAPFNTQIWGRDWHEMQPFLGISPNMGMVQGPLPYHLTHQVYNSAKINISVQSVEDQISSRTYDILASGGFLLTSDTPGVKSKLKPGIHCEVSNSPEETLEKIRYYLDHEEKRGEIARNGMNYAREQLSYQKNLAQVWPNIEAEVRTFYERRRSI